MLSVFYDGFSTAERAISRDRELAADQVGAEAASARDLGSALVKLAAFTREWGPTMEAVVTAASTPSPVDNAADRFVELVRAAAIPSALDGLDARDVPHPTDSHPPISQRLEALGLTQADLASAGLAVTLEPSSDAILVSRERDAATLTAWVNARVSAAVVEDMPAPAPA